MLYDRSELAGRVEHTLVRAVTEEVVVVAFVVLLFLLHPASALVPMITLPLIVLLTFAGLRLFGVPVTVMSLGGIAIALGMAVDAELVALEACHRRLEIRRQPRAGVEPWRRRRLVAAAGALAPAILTSLLIAALAFVPVFAFGGETGPPPAAAGAQQDAGGARGRPRHADARPRAARSAVPGPRRPGAAQPADRARSCARTGRSCTSRCARPAITLVTAALAAISCLPIVSHLGSEFLPHIDEGELLYMPTAAAGLSARRRARRADGAGPRHRRLAGRADAVFGKIGRSDSATDPAPFSMAETTIRLKPRAEWPQGLPRALVLELGARAGQAPAAADLAGARADDDRRARRAAWTRTRIGRAGRTPGPRRCARAWT